MKLKMLAQCPQQVSQKYVSWLRNYWGWGDGRMQGHMNTIILQLCLNISMSHFSESEVDMYMYNLQ
jgi:hypothetical protein